MPELGEVAHGRTGSHKDLILQAACLMSINVFITAARTRESCQIVLYVLAETVCFDYKLRG